MKRHAPLRIERLEDRTTPSGMTNPTQLTISFVPDGTQVGSQQSHLFQDYNALASTAAWQQQILGTFQMLASQSNTTLTVVPDDGASLTGPAPQDGAIRIAAVDQLFASDGTVVSAGANAGYLVASGPATFGVGLGLMGPNGPLSPVPQTPGSGATSLLPVIMPIPRAFGNLYPTAPPTTPPSSPTPPVTPINMTPAPPPQSQPPVVPMPMTPSYSVPSGPTAPVNPSMPGNPLAPPPAMP